MAKITLKNTEVVDFISVLDSIPPGKVGSHGDNRKLDKAVDVLNEAAKSYVEKFQGLQKELLEAAKGPQKAVQEINEKIKAEDDPEAKALLEKQLTEIVNKGNLDCKPFTDKVEECRNTDGASLVEIEIEDDLHAVLVTQYNNHAANSYNNRKAYLALGNALGVTE